MVYMSLVRIGTPTLSRYFELKASKPQQKKAPMVKSSHNLFDFIIFLLLPTMINAEKAIITIIAITDLAVNGALKMKTEATAVKTT